jgi:hypothetical protein
MESSASFIGSNNIKLAKTCLGLIRDISGRGACSQDPEYIGYALQELSQVLLERTGSDNRLFEPIPADQIEDLDHLFSELDLINSFSESMAASAHRCGSAWLWMHWLGLSVCRCESQNADSGGPWS